MIGLYESCSELIYVKLKNQEKNNIFLPEDICVSVVNRLRNFNISFYKVNRNWTISDNYIIPPLRKDDILLVSDLFNFRTIDIHTLPDCKIVLDLAHCSYETLAFYLEKFRIANKKVLFSCISMGAGKYYRYGGGGVFFDIKNIAELNDFSFNQVNYTSLNLDSKYCALTNEYSTRHIVSAKNISAIEIDKLRKNGISISDGLFSHISGKRSNEYYFWKDITE